MLLAFPDSEEDNPLLDDMEIGSSSGGALHALVTVADLNRAGDGNHFAVIGRILSGLSRAADDYTFDVLSVILLLFILLPSELSLLHGFVFNHVSKFIDKTRKKKFQLSIFQSIVFFQIF